MNFYEFASNSPWLTFFLALILGDVIISIFRAMFGYKKDKKVKPMIARDE